MIRRVLTFALTVRELLREPDVEDALGCFLALVMCAIVGEIVLGVTR